jgi:hypothetical protein
MLNTLMVAICGIITATLSAFSSASGACRTTG